jgi:hypothetical protein
MMPPVTTLRATTAHRSVAWSKPGNLGVEFALVDLSPDSLRAEGFAIGFEPEPYQLRYRLRTTAQFVTSKVVVTTRGDGWARQLGLLRTTDGSWIVRADQRGTTDLPPAGGDTLALAGALDADLGLSPLTNAMPVLRHRLHEAGASVDFLMAWISVPDLSVHPSPQRYRYLETRSADERLVRFEATGEGDDFVADLVFDADGLVIDYPTIATRLGPGGRAREVRVPGDEEDASSTADRDPHRAAIRGD